MSNTRISRVALAAIALTAVAAAGCSSSGSGASGGGGGQVSIALISGHADGYYQALVCGAMRAAKKLGASVNAQGPTEFSASAQVPLIDAAVAKSPDALVVVPTDATALVAPLTQAKSAGIKIVTTDTTIAAEGQSIVSSQISDDNEAGGVQAAKLLVKAMGDSGTVLVVSVTPGISTTDARAAGFAKEMKNHPAIKLLDTQYDANEPAKASAATTSSLAAHSDIKGIYGTNNNTVEGVVNGLRSSGAAGKVSVVGWDGSPAEITALESGDVSGLMVSNPGIEGQYAVEQAVHAVKGDPVTKTINSPITAVTKDNLTSADAKMAIADYAYGPNTAC